MVVGEKRNLVHLACPFPGAFEKLLAVFLFFFFFCVFCVAAAPQSSGININLCSPVWFQGLSSAAGSALPVLTAEVSELSAAVTPGMLHWGCRG